MSGDGDRAGGQEPEESEGGGAAADLARRVSVSILWVALGTIVSKLLRLAALFVVLGVISDGELGVAQLALTVFAILQSVTELGLGVALIQSRKLEEGDLAALFWVSLLASVGLYALVFVASFAFAAWYDQPILAPLIQVQALGVIFFALYLVPKSMLSRALRMGRVTFAENLAGAISAGIMIGLALAGLGIWSIIIGEVGARFIEMVIHQLSSPYLPRFVWAPRRIRHLLSFGLYTTGSRFLFRFFSEVDYLVLGRYFSDSVIGLYAFAFRTVDDLVKTLLFVVSQVAYPTFAQLQDDKAELERYLYGISRGSTLFIGVILAFVFVFIEPTLLALGYDTWLPAVDLVRLFAVIGILKSVFALLQVLFNALGDARFILIHSVIMAAALFASFIVGATLGVEGVAWAWIIVFPAVSFILVVAAARRLKTSLWGFIARVGAGFPFPLALTLGLEGLRALLESAELGPGLITLVGLLVTLGAGAAFAWRFERPFIDRVFRKKKAPTP